MPYVEGESLREFGVARAISAAADERVTSAGFIVGTPVSRRSIEEDRLRGGGGPGAAVEDRERRRLAAVYPVGARSGLGQDGEV